MEIHATSPQISCPLKRGTKYVINHRQLVEDNISGEIIDSRYISPFKIVGRFIEIEILTYRGNIGDFGTYLYEYSNIIIKTSGKLLTLNKLLIAHHY